MAETQLIKPNQLRQARESMGYSREEVAERLEVTSGEILAWENGIKEPDVEVLWDLAELYGRTTDYFLKDYPSLPTQVKFRDTQLNYPAELSPKVREVLVRFDELCRAAQELKALLDQVPQVMIKPVLDVQEPEDLAVKERSRLGLGVQALSLDELRIAIEGQGVNVFFLPIPPEDTLSGLSWWHETYGPCILVNTRDVQVRKAFTLAHEYAHLLRSDPPTVCDVELDGFREERFANRFSAFFLMPRTAIVTIFQEVVGETGAIPAESQLQRLARRYTVSREALVYHLEELNLIPRGAIQPRIAGPPRYRGKPGGRAWKRRLKELGPTYAGMAFNSHVQGYVSLGKLASYLGLNVWQTVDAIEGYIGPAKRSNA